MKKIFTQSIAIILVLGIVVLAGTTSAGNPAIPNPGGFSANNTPFPVNTALGIANDQIKAGGLVVEAFIAFQNAAFDQATGVQGIITGKASSATNSALSIGDAIAANKVNLQVNGTTYARELTTADGQAALYSKVVAAPGQLQPLCATQAGEIIACPGPVVLPPTGGGLLVKNDLGVAGSTISGINNYSSWITFNGSSPYFPIGTNQTKSGVHDAFSGTLTVLTVLTEGAHLEIFADSTRLNCSGTLATGNHSFTFNSLSIGVNQDVLILLSPGDQCN